MSRNPVLFQEYFDFESDEIREHLRMAIASIFAGKDIIIRL